jgi:hypothetical protein
MQNNNIRGERVAVVDIEYNELSPMFADKAMKLLINNEAEIFCNEPFTIRLLRLTKSQEVKKGVAND